MRKLISIVVPVRNENEFLRPFYYDLLKHIDPYHYELIWVNNASTDSTLEDIQFLMQKDRSIRCITLRKETTVKGAILSGMNYAKGDFIIIMKGDLRHPASMVPMMLQKLEEGVEIVQMKPNNALDTSRIKRRLFDLLYQLNPVHSRSGLNDISEFKGLSRSVADDILFIYQQHIFIEEFFKWEEYSSTILFYEKRKCESHLFRYSKANLLYTFKIQMEHASPGQLKKFDVGGKIASAVGLAGFLFCLLLKNSRLAHVELTYFVTSMLVFILGTQLWIMSNYRRKLKKDLYQYSTSNQYRIEHIYDNDDEEQSVTTYVESQKNNICIRKAS